MFGKTQTSEKHHVTCTVRNSLQSKNQFISLHSCYPKKKQTHLTTVLKEAYYANLWFGELDNVTALFTVVGKVRSQITSEGCGFQMT